MKTVQDFKTLEAKNSTKSAIGITRPVFYIECPQSISLKITHSQNNKETQYSITALETICKADVECDKVTLADPEKQGEIKQLILQTTYIHTIQTYSFVCEYR